MLHRPAALRPEVIKEPSRRPPAWGFPSREGAGRLKDTSQNLKVAPSKRPVQRYTFLNSPFLFSSFRLGLWGAEASGGIQPCNIRQTDCSVGGPF